MTEGDSGKEKNQEVQVMKEPLSCLCCGKCCFVDLTAYAEKEDFDRWRAENRHDILDMIEHRHRRNWAEIIWQKRLPGRKKLTKDIIITIENIKL